MVAFRIYDSTLKWIWQLHKNGTSAFPKRNKIKPNETFTFLDFWYSETNCPTLCNHFRRWTIVIWDKFLHQVQRPSTSRKNSRTIPPLHKLGPWWHLCVQMTSWLEFQLKDFSWLFLALYLVQLIWTSNTNPESCKFFVCLFLFFTIKIKIHQKMPIQIVMLKS